MLECRKVRVTVGYENFDKLEKYFQKISPECYVLAFEDKDKKGRPCLEHFHGYVETEVKEYTVRAQLRKIGKYSYIKAAERMPFEYLAYNIKYNDARYVGISDELLEKYRAHNREVKTMIKENKKKRMSVKSKIEVMFKEQYKYNGTNWLDSEGCVPTKDAIMDIVLAYYRESDSLVREFFIVSMCQTFCLKYVPSYYYDFKRRVYEKI